MTASEEAEIAGKRKPRTQTTGSTRDLERNRANALKNALKKHDVFVVFFSGAADQT